MDTPNYMDTQLYEIWIFSYGYDDIIIDLPTNDQKKKRSQKLDTCETPSSLSSNPTRVVGFMFTQQFCVSTATRVWKLRNPPAPVGAKGVSFRRRNKMWILGAV